jgi:hypothetical protein
VHFVDDVDLEPAARYLMFSRSSRMSSTPVFDAASISNTSLLVEAAISRHEAHFPHGSGVGPADDSQLSALAKMRATVVLPTPRVPVNR